MAGLAFIIVGKRGCGKTSLSKIFLKHKPKNMPCLIYDVNKEYQDYYPHPVIPFEEFIVQLSDEHLEKTYVLVEESTIFFSTHNRERDMIHALVTARHTGNIIQLNFHSFRSVPKNIYELLDHVIVFKTNDNEKDVQEKFDNPNVMEAFREIRAAEEIPINKNKPTIQPYKVAKLY